jgi:Zn-dependent protease with chaperone function
MGLAWGTNLLLSSAALMTSTANFLNNDATWSVGIVVFGASWDVLVRLAGRFLPYEKFKEFSQTQNYLASKQNERVRNVIDKLDSDGTFAHTIIIPTEKTDNFVFLDRYGRKNVLFFNPLDSAVLSERELTNVIAHELAHGNKLYTGMLDTQYFMMRLAAPAIFFSTFVSTFNGISSGGFISGTFAAVSGIALGALYTSAVTLGSRALSAITSRANEIRTDIRAVEITQDVGGYISALEKASSKVDGPRSKGPKKPVAVLPSMDSHPPIELRQRYVLRTTEGKK